MNDAEARYLIDQYNKYVSWRTRRQELPLMACTLGVTIVVVFISLSSFLNASSAVPSRDFAIRLGVVAIIIVFLVLGMFSWFLLKADCEQDVFAERLMLPEDYRFKHRALPNSITLRLIVEKPEEASLFQSGGFLERDN
jgi:hypothetical protein